MNDELVNLPVGAISVADAVDTNARRDPQLG
jgi:hypothetical protein